MVGGDILGGPLPGEALALLRDRPEPLHWVAGNAEREAVTAFDGTATADDDAGRAAAWSALALDPAGRDEIAAWPIALSLDGVLYCHGSPRRDDEIVTRATPEATLVDASGGSEEPLIVSGHTHQQFVYRVGADRTWANAGSVGMPYEGQPGAFWTVVEDGVPAPRQTAYDVNAAARELRATGFPDVESLLAESLLDPVDADWVTAFFEH